MKKNLFIAIIVALVSIILLSPRVETNKNTPVTIESHTLLLHYTIEEKIKRAEIIVIGEVKTVLPSRWNGPNGSDPTNASPEEIFHARGLFTDSLILVNQILKGEIGQPIVRVRSFIGETEKVRWVNKSEPSFVTQKTYLLFLVKDTGATAKVDPGDYVSLGAFQGVYEITDGEAKSFNDEWNLEDLIAYIEKSLSTSTPAAIPSEQATETFTPMAVPTELVTETPLPSTASPTATPTSTETLTETPLPYTASPAPTDSSTETPPPTP